MSIKATSSTTTTTARTSLEAPVRSPTYEYYRDISPKEHTVRLPTKSYEELKRDLPANFRLSRVDEIFRAWLETFTSASLTLPTGRDTLNVFYEYDHLLYRSAAYLDRYYARSTWNQNMCIKLANDGYIYTKIEELSTKRTNQTRHRSNTWSILLEPHIRELPSLCDFAKSYFRENKIKVELWYDFEKQRIDFKVWGADATSGLTITLEPAYPEVDGPTEDFWVEI